MCKICENILSFRKNTNITCGNLYTLDKEPAENLQSISGFIHYNYCPFVRFRIALCFYSQRHTKPGSLICFDNPEKNPYLQYWKYTSLMPDAMIDTHCHIYLPQFQTDIHPVLDRAAQAGITDIMMPAIDFGSLKQMDALGHPHIRFHKMIGIHPCDVDGSQGDSGSQAGLEEQLLEKGSAGEIIAIGETGLDYYWSREHIAAQQESLRQHCQAAKALDKPVILHNRDSTEDLLDIIGEQQDGRLRGIWHCFNGTPAQGRRALDLGLYLGIGGVVTFKNAGVDRVVADMPPDRLVLETDAPYLAPVPMRGKRNEPSYIKFTAEKLSELFDISLEETDRITTENARRLFRCQDPSFTGKVM